MSEADKFSNCWKENKSGGLNQKCSGAAEWTNEVGGVGALYDWSCFCDLRHFPTSGPSSGACGQIQNRQEKPTSSSCEGKVWHYGNLCALLQRVR